MKAKEYLKKLQWLDTAITQKISELDDLRMKLCSVSGIDYSKEQVQSTHSGDAAFVNTICKIEELEKEVDAEIDNFIVEKHKIINQIQKLGNTKHIDILYKKYVEFKSLELVSVEMNYTYQYIVLLHGYALKEFQERFQFTFND